MQARKKWRTATPRRPQGVSTVAQASVWGGPRRVGGAPGVRTAPRRPRFRSRSPWIFAPSKWRRINELYNASVDTTPRVQKTLGLIYPKSEGSTRRQALHATPELDYHNHVFLNKVPPPALGRVRRPRVAHPRARLYLLARTSCLGPGRSGWFCTQLYFVVSRLTDRCGRKLSASFFVC
jgi:hypothetical protein